MLTPTSFKAYFDQRALSSLGKFWILDTKYKLREGYRELEVESTAKGIVWPKL